VDLVTFWVPGFNGFPVSDSYEDCLEATPPAQAAIGSAPTMPTAQESPSLEQDLEHSAPVTVVPKAEQPRYTK
jgi:hypothetical protein